LPGTELSSVPTHPERIGEFAIEKQIGQGGMASVYLVRDPHTGQPMALKAISENLGEEIDRLRFEREFRLAARFDHPNLVKVFEMGYWQSRPYYTMELVQGSDVRSYLQEQSRHLPWDNWIVALGAIGAQILAGLEYIHTKQVVHRDLKPENLLVDAYGQVRFLDFGLARDTLSDTRMTKTGMILGTPMYMAPEQWGVGQVDARSDLYAVGVILYELLSGRLPHPTQDMRTMVFHLLTKSAEPLLPFGPLPERLEALIMQMLERDPGARPASCQEALTDWLTIFPHLSVARSGGNRELYHPSYQGQQSLLEAAEVLLQKRRGILVVRGEGGGGKSRWLDEVARLGVRTYWQVAQARCGAWRGIPYGPWIEVLRAVFETGLPPDLESERTTLALLLPELGASAQLGEGGKWRLFRSVRQALSKRNPGLVILFDDIQYLDEVSRELLTYLLATELPGLVVAATIESQWPLAEFPTSLLEPFTQDQAQIVAESMLGRRLQAQALERFWLTSRGNPLFLCELVRGAFFSGELKLEDQTYVYAEQLALPTRLEQALERRMQALQPQEKQLLVWLAGWQGRAEFETLASFFGQRSREQLVDDLEALVRHQLVIREGKGYFLLPQVGRVVMSSLPPELGRKLHADIAGGLETLKPPAEERIALHWQQADQPERARPWLMLAAVAQARLYNYQRALELYRRVEKLPGEVPESLAALKAEALMGAKKVDEALKAYEQLGNHARFVLQQARCHWLRGDLERSREVLSPLLSPLPSSSKWQQLCFQLCHWRTSAGWPPRSAPPASLQLRIHNWYRRNLRWTRPTGWQADALALCWRDFGGFDPRMSRIFALLLCPRPSALKARKLLLSLCDQAIARGSCELLVELGGLALLAGCVQAQEILRTAWLRAEQQGSMVTLVESANLLTYLHRLSGRLGLARRWLGELQQAVHYAQDPLEQWRYQIQRGHLQLMAGELPAAEETLESLARANLVPRLQRDRSLLQAYFDLFQGRRERALELSQPFEPVGLERLAHLEVDLLHAHAGGGQVKQLLRDSQEVYPIFRVAALRLSGQLESALGLARKWEFPLEEGLCLAALSRSRNQPELLQMAREALEKSQLANQRIEQILLRPGTHPYDRL